MHRHPKRKDNIFPPLQSTNESREACQELQTVSEALYKRVKGMIPALHVDGMNAASFSSEVIRKVSIAKRAPAKRKNVNMLNNRSGSADSLLSYLYSWKYYLLVTYLAAIIIYVYLFVRLFHLFIHSLFILIFAVSDIKDTWSNISFYAAKSVGGAWVFI